MRRILVVAAMTATLVPGPTAHADGETCQGQPATIVSDDRVVTGTSGDDVILVELWGSGGSVDGLEGDDLICASGNPIRGSKGDQEVSGGDGEDSLVLLGSLANDAVRISGMEQLDVKMRAGYDVVRIADSWPTGTLDGGFGDDLINVDGYDKILVDLGVGRVDVADAGFDITKFSNARATGRAVELVGDRFGNRLEAFGCRSVVKGGGGHDRLRTSTKKLEQLDCDKVRGARIFGENGDDEMYGADTNDLLDGGPGYDSAVAGQGRDRCVAEWKKGCER